MHTGSIVREATAKARWAVLVALAGVVLTALAFFAERALFQGDLANAANRVAEAYHAADQILLADEQLTMSANMAAATGEDRWIDRYEQSLALIDTAIATAISLAPADVARRFDAETRVANDTLVRLEHDAFDAVRRGDLAMARTTLNGIAYSANKAVLSDGTTHFTDGVIAAVRGDLQAVQGRALWLFGVIVLLAALCSALLWRTVTASLSRSEGAFLESERRIQALAMSVMLTGLANRVSLRHALDIAIDQANLNRTKVALLMIDLDRFKPINDRHGHLIGDLVLKEVAQRMAGLLRAGELRARFGGDEFVAVVEYEDDDAIPLDVAERLIDGLSEPMMFDGLTLQVGASIGIAVCPDNARTEDELIHRADLALYRAKLEGRGAARAYDASLDIEMDARAALADELSVAIARGEVVPYFQPLVDLSTGIPRGFEILSRWEHPTRGLIPPADFIDLAESSGLIGALTISVLRQACVVARALPSRLTLSLNLSPLQLQDGWLSSQLLAVLAETGFPPGRLEVEMTEHALVTDLALAKQVITSLKNQGVRIALDDFGTGFSSLSYLTELAFDCIKIDRSFIRTLADRPESAKVVSAIVGLGKSLGMTIVAEGVESERDAAVLREIGCPTAQGFLYSHAVPAGELIATIAQLEGQETKASVEAASRAVA
jgi:diguanylate cyclase (GGDEF)-like protein